MSIVKEKPQLDLVFKAHPGAIGQEIEQKDRHNDAFEIYGCFKELETANFETLNPKMKFSIQPAVYFISSNASTLSGKVRKIEESGLTLLQTAEKDRLNFNRLTGSYPVLTGRATELCSCPRAPRNIN